MSIRQYEASFKRVKEIVNAYLDGSVELWARNELIDKISAEMRKIIRIKDGEDPTEEEPKLYLLDNPECFDLAEANEMVRQAQAVLRELSVKRSNLFGEEPRPKEVLSLFTTINQCSSALHVIATQIENIENEIQDFLSNENNQFAIDRLNAIASIKASMTAIFKNQSN